MKKILAIDDQKDNLTTIKAVIESYIPECHVLTAQSGEEGLIIAKEEQPSTILLDIIMPKMDGYDVCKKLKTDESTKHIPVVMITAIKTDSESRVRGLKLGADAFLSKPIDPTELSAQVHVMLRIKRAENILRADKKNLENIVLNRTRDLREINVKLNQEITERKKTEEELIASRNYLESLTNSMWDTVFSIKMPERVIEWTNDSIRHIGYEAKECIGKNMAFLYADNDDYLDFGNKLKEAISERKAVIHSDQLLRRKNGKTFPTEITVSFHWMSDKVVSITSIVSDITERKRTEKELIRAKEKAEESDRLKTAFLANMSHEIRTPINGIKGFANLLQKPGYTQEKSKHFTKIIINSSLQLLHIIENILDLSKIETGEIDLIEEKIALDSFLKENILSLFEIRAKEKKISLNLITDLSPQNIIVLVDKSKLEQIICNLIENALKFTEKGSIDFGYKIKENQLEFFVKDSGIGIPKKYHKSIFNRFSKVEDNFKFYEGTGIGLSICTGLLEKMEGTIWVESKKDKGAEFYFTIPYKTSTQEKVSELRKNITKSNLSDKTILVVEDEQNNATYLQEFLSNNQIKPFFAKNGKQAIDIFKKNPNIDLILMDIKLPVIDGYVATQEMKKIKPDIPVIAQTAYVKLKENAFKAGCDDYISKPINEKKLTDLLERYLKK